MSFEKILAQCVINLLEDRARLGNASARSLPMPTAWLPCPGKVNATVMRGSERLFCLSARRVFLACDARRHAKSSHFNPDDGGVADAVRASNGLFADHSDENRSRIVCWLFLFAQQALVFA